MPRLTPKHLSLLRYFADEQHIDQCYSPGRACGEFSCTPDTFSQGIFNSLLTWGLLRFTTYQSFGIHWYRFSISAKGRATLNLLGKR